MARVLIAGCGYVGSALGRSLAGDGNTVFGVRRHPAGLPDPIEPVEADLAVPATLQAIPKDLQQIVYAVSPGGAEDLLYRTAYVDGLRNLLDLLRERDEHPTRIVFVSSTAVYGQSDAEWVDETTDGAPTHWSGKRLLEAEALLRDSEFPGTVLRLGGIYGPRRTRMLQRIRAGQMTYRSNPPQFTNRIHLDDCVGALRHLLTLDAPEPVYLGVDCEPADERTVTTWMAGALGAPAPRPASPEEEEAPRTRGNKRARNDRLVESGYAFRYPTFREGYQAVIEGLG